MILQNRIELIDKVINSSIYDTNPQITPYS